jgi:predicted amidophosphoribosyltransferase
MTLEELIRGSDAAAVHLVPPPSDAPDVCPRCRGWRPLRHEKCWNCAQVESRLTRPCFKVIPISLYRKPSQLRDWVKYYKRGHEQYHPEFEGMLAAILGRFLLQHGRALSYMVGGFDDIAVVPSTTRRNPHPLTRLGEQLPHPHGSRFRQLLTRASAPVGHNVMSDEAFRALPYATGRRLLLLDDVYTSGATAQSAASTLQLAGAKVTAILVLARRINPEFSDEARQVWERQSQRPFGFIDAPFWLNGANYW